MSEQYVIKDSGERQQFASGMVRDTTDNKVDYTLVLDGPLLDRVAKHLTLGAKKYAKRNWMKADGKAEYDRFKESAFRHFLQWYRGDIDEDHFAATVFNLNGAEFVKAKLDKQIHVNGPRENIQGEVRNNDRAVRQDAEAPERRMRPL